jgi:hypothetical protein
MILIWTDVDSRGDGPQRERANTLPPEPSVHITVGQVILCGLLRETRYAYQHCRPRPLNVCALDSPVMRQGRSDGKEQLKQHPDSTTMHQPQKSARTSAKAQNEST